MRNPSQCPNPDRCEVVNDVSVCIDCIFVMIHGCFHYYVYLCTYLGRKSTKESIPEVAQSEGKVFVEEIPAIYHNVRLINIMFCNRSYNIDNKVATLVIKGHFPNCHIFLFCDIWHGCTIALKA